jgi:protein-S-isoprenylcysteine O-methyltransferase Ste14
MWMLLRHLFSVAALPFVVTVVVPTWLIRSDRLSLALGAEFPQRLTQAAGLGLLAIGLLLFGASLRRFATEGKGTLAPWDPPRHLVVRGPYRYVRNPMISGVLFILFAEAALFLSRSLLSWAVLFLVINFVYIPVLEEPQLRQRFGGDYDEYCRHVRRFIPRLRPWDPAGGTSKQ